MNEDTYVSEDVFSKGKQVWKSVYGRCMCMRDTRYISVCSIIKLP